MKLLRTSVGRSRRIGEPDWTFSFFLLKLQWIKSKTLRRSSGGKEPKGDEHKKICPYYPLQKRERRKKKHTARRYKFSNTKTLLVYDYSNHTREALRQAKTPTHSCIEWKCKQEKRNKKNKGSLSRMAGKTVQHLLSQDMENTLCIRNKRRQEPLCMGTILSKSNSTRSKSLPKTQKPKGK